MKPTYPQKARILKGLPLAAIAALSACGGNYDDDGGNEAEVITTITLTFTPSGGGTAVVASFDDPDGDGGEPPVVDEIALDAGDYDLAITFANGLEDPPEDITQEILDEADEHQIFLTGSAVNGPASDEPGAPLTHSYADQDANGNPIGLANDISAAAGTGTLKVTLRHLPPIGGSDVKTEGLAESVRSEGFSAIGGESDARVDFDVTVQ
jgi:hypothetical protein